MNTRAIEGPVGRSEASMHDETFTQHIACVLKQPGQVQLKAHQQIRRLCRDHWKHAAEQMQLPARASRIDSIDL